MRPPHHKMNFVDSESLVWFRNIYTMGWPRCYVFHSSNSNPQMTLSC